MIPVKYRMHGNRQECDALGGQARRVMLILDNMMRLGKLQQHEIRFAPYDGAIIVARNTFGRRVVDIYAGAPPPPPPELVEYECICNCNLAIGWVLELQVDTIGGAQLYTVMACNRQGKVYVPYQDVLASDFTPYEIGQMVVLVPYNGMAYLCCTDKTGGESMIRGCSPIVSTENKDANEWRTAYRMIPWCALTVSKKLRQGKWNHNG